jgi:EXLDI family protein
MYTHVVPNKTIYVADDDLPLLDAARGLAGSLSRGISEALKRYVKAEQGISTELCPVTVEVTDGPSRRIQFVGRRLVRWKPPREVDSTQRDLVDIYQTAKLQFAAHTRTYDRSPYLDDHDFEEWSPVTRAVLEVFADSGALAERFPSDVVQAAERETSRGTIEVLDI